MSSQQEAPTQLDQDSAAKLTDFARAIKAAARAVTLYPSSHPAIRLSLARLVEASSRMTAKGSVTLGVAPDNILLDGAASPRPDQAVRETGALFHDHMIGLVTLHSSPSPDGWLPFLNILAKSLDEVRAAGGVARLWGATGQRHLDLQQIDYADILRERQSTLKSRWDDILRACLNLNSPLDDETLKGLLDVCGDPERFSEFVVALQENGDTNMGSKASALLRMLRGVVDSVSRTDPGQARRAAQERRAGIWHAVARVASRTPLYGRRTRRQGRRLRPAGREPDDGLHAGRVRRPFGGGARWRHQPAGAGVPGARARSRTAPRVLEMARAELEESPIGAGEDFVDLWKNAADLLASYSDEQFVSEDYARELSEARTQAVDVERVSDDPPERIAVWVGSVSAAEVRALDLQLLIDLLKIETDHERWKGITIPVVSHIEDLLLVGDFDAAIQLATILVDEAKKDGPRQAAAYAAVDRMVHGAMAMHIVSHVRSVDDEGFKHLEKLCYMVGPSVVKPLAEALAAEKRTVARQRFTQILLGYGADGRLAVEQLRASANPAVRRTAIHLLREFGGSEALPDLTSLLADAEPNVQREAVRAILSIGSEDAYAELQRALTTGTNQAREALTGALVAMRSERAIPLFEYIVRKIDRKGPLRSVYLRAVESLGALKAEQAVELLKDALYSGEWWAPFRTAELRRTVATALRQIGTPNAQHVLEEAARSGPAGVRSAVKAAR